MTKNDCLQCQGGGGRWTPTWSPHLPNPEVKPTWSTCEYCGGRGWLREHAELLQPGFHEVGTPRALAAELLESGIEMRPVENLSSLWGLGLPADYLSLIDTVGIVTGTDGYDMLTPSEVRDAVQRQHEFYDGATFGDSDEDQRALQAEAAFRRRLIPFQYVGTRGDFFCYLTSSNKPAIILDVYHDDYELAGAAFDEEPTPYTTDIIEHLRWVAQMIDNEGGYPP